jgi:flagellar biosynthetic protein FliR
MVVFAPVFGHSAVPVRLRLLIGAAMGLAAVGRLPRPVALPGSSFDLMMGLGCEFLIGAAIGYAARLIFTGVELGAFHVSSQMGLALADVVDPTKADSPSAVRGVFRLVAVVVFLAVGGHRALVGGLLGTFEAMPPLGFPPGSALLDSVVAMLAASFVLALKVAAPVLIAMLLATVALGLLQRTVPQCNMLSIGLPVRTMLGLVVLAASLGALAPLMNAAAAHLARSVQALAAAAR